MMERVRPQALLAIETRPGIEENRLAAAKLFRHKGACGG